MNRKLASVAFVFALSLTCLEAVALGERTFRPERFALSDTAVRRVQPIDSASWIWREGLDNEINVAPPRFFRFRRRFVSPGGTARTRRARPSLTSRTLHADNNQAK